MTPIEEAGRLGLALAMAVFIGLAFEETYKRDERSSPGGIRTFPMLATLGAMLFLLDSNSVMPFVVGLAAVAAWLYAHIRLAPTSDGQRPSLMIPTANLFAYTLGPIALKQPPWIVVSASIIAVLLLQGRDTLHRLVRRVAPEEAFTLGKFLILVGIILPLLPNHAVVSWTSITPVQVWLALVAISGLSYISYLLQRYLPSTHPLLPAVLGGVYSSTVTTVALARQQKGSAEPRPELSAGIITATTIMYLRIGIVIALFDLRLAALLLPALLGLFLSGAAFATWEWRRRTAVVAATTVPAINPLQLVTAVTFAAMFVLVTVASSWVRTSLGERGVLVVAVVAGAADVDPFVLSLAQGGVAGMSPQSLAAAILIAASSNNALKAFYAALFGGLRACRRPATNLLILGLIGLGMAAIYLR